MIEDVKRDGKTVLCRGIRGATVAESNSREAILEATQELLLKLVEANQIRPEQVAAALFTTTPDLDADFPAAAGHLPGWEHVALLGAQEIRVPGAPPRCIRILLLVNTDKEPRDLVHVYLRGTESLRAKEKDCK